MIEWSKNSHITPFEKTTVSTSTETTNEPPLVTPDNNLPSKLSQKRKDLKLWHQRMGYSPTQIINETRKYIEGIPEIPTNTPLIECPFCEMAKMMKHI